MDANAVLFVSRPSCDVLMSRQTCDRRTQNLWLHFLIQKLWQLFKMVWLLFRLELCDVLIVDLWTEGFRSNAGEFNPEKSINLSARRRCQYFSCGYVRQYLIGGVLSALVDWHDSRSTWKFSFNWGLVSKEPHYYCYYCYAVMKNPANLAKHQANPKVAPLIAKMLGKFGGGAARQPWGSSCLNTAVY